MRVARWLGGGKGGEEMVNGDYWGLKSWLGKAGEAGVGREGEGLGRELRRRGGLEVIVINLLLLLTRVYYHPVSCMYVYLFVDVHG